MDLDDAVARGLLPSERWWCCKVLSRMMPLVLIKWLQLCVCSSVSCTFLPPSQSERHCGWRVQRDHRLSVEASPITSSIDNWSFWSCSWLLCFWRPLFPEQPTNKGQRCSVQCFNCFAWSGSYKAHEMHLASQQDSCNKHSPLPQLLSLEAWAEHPWFAVYRFYPLI